MDAGIENQDDEIERLLGFTPPGEAARRRRRERMAATNALEAHAAARRQDMEGYGNSTPENMEMLNIADVMHGVTVGWLSQAFSMDPTTVKKKLRDCPPIHRRKAGFVYDLKAAAQFLVKPVFDVDGYLRSMKATDLPTHLQEAYWSAMRKRQQWEADAGHLWRTEHVMEVFGDVFQTIKFAMQLWPDTVERALGLSAEQRTMLVGMSDELQNEIYKKLKQMPGDKRTPSSLSEATTGPLLGEDISEPDDDYTSII